MLAMMLATNHQPSAISHRCSHDHKRNGTIDLFAVLDIASGNVITEFRLNHASAQFIKFLNKINREVPAELDVHVVLDDLSTHKTRAVHKWRLRHKRFHFHFTPTYGSWINLVERWFSALTTKKLQRSAHGPVNALAADIRDWVDIWNKDPTPFVWHKTADEILERFGRYLAATWPTTSTPTLMMDQPDKTLVGLRCPRCRIRWWGGCRWPKGWGRSSC